MEKSYVVSYDVGTSSVKTVFVDFTGDVVSVANANYDLLTPQLGWAEQDPEAYWNAVCISTKQALTQAGISPERVKGVAFGTQWKGVIPLDFQNKVLHNNIIWLDSRAVKQADQLNEKLKTNFIMGNDYWPKVMWVKEELPEIYEKTVCFLEVNAFLKFKATGMKTVDLTNNFINSIDKNQQTLYDNILKAAELDPEKFPPLVMTTEKIGGITAEAAGEMGLLEGTPVFGGCGDIPAITIGSGCLGEGKTHVYLGSSGWMGTIAKRGTTADDFYMTIDRDLDVRLDGIRSAGMFLNWAIDQFYHAEKEEKKAEIYNFVNEEIKDIPAGSLNMIATPWIFGAFPPVAPTAKAVFFNITNLHDRRYIVNAVLEGICYQVRLMKEIYQNKFDKTLESVRIVGGCTTSDHWMQMMADVLQIPVEVPVNSSHAGALGTAYCAFIGLGIYDGFTEAERKIKLTKTFFPRKDNSTTYDVLYELFTQISPTLEKMFNTVNQ